MIVKFIEAAFIIISKNVFFPALDACAKKSDCTVGCISLLLPKCPTNLHEPAGSYDLEPDKSCDVILEDSEADTWHGTARRV